MTLELYVETGARAGVRARFDGDRVVVGRDPAADLRLDAAGDRDASARHLELRRSDGAWRVRDLGSTNGTFVNGRRAVDEVPVHDGDRITCGADGPAIVVRLVGAPPAARGARRSRGAALAVAAAALVVAAIATTVVVQRRATARVLAADSLRVAADSARVAAARDAADARTRADSLAAADDARVAEPVVVAAEPARAAPVPLATAALDAAALARRAGRAVALVAVEAADGTASSGTAFGVSESGLLVTNRHVVTGADGAAPRRIAVKYADTDDWLEARLVRRHPDADVAAIQVVAPGRRPAIAHIADADPAPGSEIVVLGFPAGAEAPRERATGDGVARVAVFRGLVSKVAEGTVVVDAYAGHGSSGSPVLDARGAVVGVVYGGKPEAAGRVALAASSAALRELLRGLPR
jgi:S1-C subfamily serine protease